MWAVFEWENKVAVNTTLTDLHDYLEHLLKVNTLEKTTYILNLSFFHLYLFNFSQPT